MGFPNDSATIGVETYLIHYQKPWERSSLAHLDHVYFDLQSCSTMAPGTNPCKEKSPIGME